MPTDDRTYEHAPRKSAPAKKQTRVAGVVRDIKQSFTFASVRKLLMTTINNDSYTSLLDLSAVRSEVAQPSRAVGAIKTEGRYRNGNQRPSGYTGTAYAPRAIVRYTPNDRGNRATRRGKSSVRSSRLTITPVDAGRF